MKEHEFRDAAVLIDRYNYLKGLVTTIDKGDPNSFVVYYNDYDDLSRQYPMPKGSLSHIYQDALKEMINIVAELKQRFNVELDWWLYT